ncbi:DNA/RNA polymerase [Vararia minispora EC-137]|uniref:DNA/RNA polymerase n=1 Tax=Vararia minispora EC-137 TaxID=1314806 RepID=A0ACB8QCG0_9AGAM|nr:DNA/RNA polymerase [Vararia minispora EC-137]
MFKPPSSKGKGRAEVVIDPDFEDLFPVITYRHVLSPPPGARNPLRVIALCDSDAFYAACEQGRLGIDPSRPLVVRQWEALIAVNYPARKYGISRMSKWKDALEKCPELVVVHVATYREGDTEPQYRENPDTQTHKISLDFYRRESMKILAIFKECLPSGEIEKASIDEAFIDLTTPVREEMLERYPYLRQVPEESSESLDTPLPPPPTPFWDGLGNLVPINPPPSEGEDTQSEHVRTLPEDVPITWHDIALSIGAEIMHGLRAEVRKQLGYTMSAGISRNKFLAKLVASYKKFDSQSILRNAAIPNYLRPLPFQKIRFLGGKLGQALVDEYSVSTVDELMCLRMFADDIQRRFGDESIWIYEIFRGIDRSEVKEKAALNKSMLAAKNLPQPIMKTSDGPSWLRVLAAELVMRLNDIREELPLTWPKTIVLSARKSYTDGKRKQCPFPFANPLTADFVASLAEKLWKEIMGADDSIPLNVRFISLGFTGVDAGEAGQRSLEGFFHQGVPPGRKPPSNSKSASDSKPASGPIASNSKRKRETIDGDGEHDSLSFVCSRCHQRVSAPDTGSLGCEESRVAALGRARMEHDDFHFAQDLAKKSAPGQPSLRVSDGRQQLEESGSSRPLKRKKGPPSRPKEEGIAKFFVRK